MASKRKRTGSRLLGAELRRRRGGRTLQEISRLSKTPPFSDRVESIGVSTLYMIEEGQTMPTVRSLHTLATLYRVSVEHLVGLLSLERHGGTAPEGVRPEELREETLAALDSARYELAWAAAERWHEVAQTPGSRRAAANNKASALWKLGHVDEACQILLDLLAEPDISPRQALVAFTNLAEIFRSKGNLVQARVQVDAALAIARREKDEKAEAWLLRSRANAASDEILRRRGFEAIERTLTSSERDALRECLEDYQASSACYRSLGLEVEALFNEIGVGQVECLLGEHAAGLRRLEAVAETLAAKGHAYGEASALVELARGLVQRAQLEPARAALWKAEGLALEGEHDELVFNAYFLLLTIERRSEGKGSLFLKKCQRLHPILESRSPEVVAFEALLARENTA